MRRRAILLAVAGLGSGLQAFALPVLAQKRFRIGLPVREISLEARARFQAAFGKHGWADGRDYEFVLSDVAANLRLAEIGNVLAKLPDLLVVYSTAQAKEAQRISSTMPVVMLTSGYPVEVGVADSLARPGRNVTGNTAYVSRAVWGKLVQLLVEIKPGTTRIGLLWDYWPGKGIEPALKDLEQELAKAEATLGVRIHRVDVNAPEQLAAALAAIDAAKSQALIFTAGPVFWPARQQVLQFAESRWLPTITDGAIVPEDKGLRPLLTYSASLEERRNQVVEYVVRILRDRAKPGELPIRMPSKFELAIHRASAGRIGLTIPPSLLQRADRVIE
jgi:putative ABC transport system substrate-binding protein